MKFLLENIWLIGLAVLSGGALLWTSLRWHGAKVSLLQATQLLNQGKAVVIDVRDPAEFAAGHLRDAKNIPFQDLPQCGAELDKFKSKAAILVCQSGIRSLRSVGRLKKAGFAEVYALEGGIAAWQAQGLPLAK